jgi:Mg2+/Co2+ transporter CorB
MSALLAATETAITAASPGKIYKLKSEGNKKAIIALNILKLKESVISTMVIGQNLINTICTTLATVLCISLLGDRLGTIVASAIMALIIITFVEVVPKAIAVAKAESILILTAPAIIIFLQIFTPLNILLNRTVKIFCFIFRIKINNKTSGAEEVREIIEHHHQEGNVYKADRDMLGGILDIRDMTISEIMVHRSSVIALNIDLPNDEIIPLILSSAKARIPLWKDTKDNIIGVLHSRDLLQNLYENNNNLDKINIKKLITEPWFVPDNAPVIQQLHSFRHRSNHLACVVDEYGDLQGIMTLEDILEEIVGQMHHKHDDDHTIIKKSENEFIIKGSATIRDINRELGWDLPDDHATTIAGLIIYQTEHIPDQGVHIIIYNIKFTILKRGGNKIEIVRATIEES